jgi:PEP-CTERM motif
MRSGPAIRSVALAAAILFLAGPSALGASTVEFASRIVVPGQPTPVAPTLVGDRLVFQYGNPDPGGPALDVFWLDFATDARVQNAVSASLVIEGMSSLFSVPTAPVVFDGVKTPVPLSALRTEFDPLAPFALPTSMAEWTLKRAVSKYFNAVRKKGGYHYEVAVEKRIIDFIPLSALDRSHGYMKNAAGYSWGIDSTDPVTIAVYELLKNQTDQYTRTFFEYYRTAEGHADIQPVIDAFEDQDPALMLTSGPMTVQSPPSSRIKELETTVTDTLDVVYHLSYLRKGSDPDGGSLGYVWFGDDLYPDTTDALIDFPSYMLACDGERVETRRDIFDSFLVDCSDGIWRLCIWPNAFRGFTYDTIRLEVNLGATPPAPHPAGVPEPASLLMFGLGILALGVLGRRRHSASGFGRMPTPAREGMRGIHWGRNPFTRGSRREREGQSPHVM